MHTGRKPGRCLALTVALTLSCAIATYARGLTAPPPVFSGGNAGEWLGSGPLFGFDNPLGADFFIPTGYGGGGTPGGFEWHPGGGGAPEQPRGGLSCPGTCKKETWTGPCKLLCLCYYDNPDSWEGNEDHVPDRGSVVVGTCIDVGDGNDIGGCVDERARCSFTIP